MTFGTRLQIEPQTITKNETNALVFSELVIIWTFMNTDTVNILIHIAWGLGHEFQNDSSESHSKSKNESKRPCGPEDILQT